MPVPSPLPPHFCRLQPRSRRGAPSCCRLPTPALIQGVQEQVFHFDSLYPFSLSDAARKTCLIIQPMRGKIGRGATCYCRESFCCANQLWRYSTTCATATLLVVFLILTIKLSNGWMNFWKNSKRPLTLSASVSSVHRYVNIQIVFCAVHYNQNRFKDKFLNQGHLFQTPTQEKNKTS